MSVALVTGSSGFVGTRLVTALLAEGAKVAGVDRVIPGASGQERRTPSLFFQGDVGNPALIADVLARVQPTDIFHFAGMLSQTAGDSTTQYEAHVRSTVCLLDAIRAAKQDPWILVASSSAVYGATSPPENPLGEDRPLRPLNHYAASKIAQEMVALQYFLAHQLRTVRVRSFNLIGPGQPSHLLVSDVVRQVAVVERAGGPMTVRIGNLFPRRDYTDVRDAVRAYLVLARSGQPGEVYNVCTGRSYSVQDCVDTLARLIGKPVRVEVDQARVRQCEITDQVGAADRLRTATGWQPTIPLETSVLDLLAYWRKRLTSIPPPAADRREIAHGSRALGRSAAATRP